MRIFILIFVSTLLTACRDSASAQERALEASVDSIMPLLEQLSGLKKLQPITMRQQSREELRNYIIERMREEMPPEELRGMRAAYAALGLLSDTLDLEKLLLDLYTEQVAGYYDPKTNAFYMVEGTPRDLLRATLAHELVHALQDQHTNLDSLISRKRGNDRQTAAQAAIEGHATLVMFAFLAGGTNFDPAALPNLSQQLGPALEAQNEQFPVFRSAPRIIRETMLFPYISGAGFVQELWRKQRFTAPIGERLPQSTEQVMEPVEKFLTTVDHPTEVRFADTPNGSVVYENTLGQLEVAILLNEHSGSRTAATGWDGDRFRLLEQDGKQVFTWLSVWDDAPSANRFAEAYRTIGNKRGRAVRVDRVEIDGRPAVWVADAPAGTNLNAYSPARVQLQ